MPFSFDRGKSLEIADRLLGLEFEMGERGEDGKIDCYGVLCFFYREHGITLPDYSAYGNWDNKEEHYLKEYRSVARKLNPDEDPRVGDFILFKNIEGTSNHAAVYLGENLFVHAYRRIGTKIDSLTNPIWKEKVYGFFRILASEHEGDHAQS